MMLLKPYELFTMLTSAYIPVAKAKRGLFWDICARADQFARQELVARSLTVRRLMCAISGEFSVFRSMPDNWALGNCPDNPNS